MSDPTPTQAAPDTGAQSEVTPDASFAPVDTGSQSEVTPDASFAPIDTGAQSEVTPDASFAPIDTGFASGGVFQTRTEEGHAQQVANAASPWIVQPSGVGAGTLPTTTQGGDTGLEAQIMGAIGGGLQRAYLLILPPASPAGGASAALAAAAGIASQDMTGQSGGNTGNSLENIAQADTVGSSGMRIEFMFNPKEYTIKKGASWEHKPTSGGWPTSIPSWSGAKQRTMTFQMFLDSTYSGWTSIKPYVDLLFACMQPTLQSLLLEAPSPPFVMFGWGEELSFLAYIEDVSAKFTLFKPDGTPVRAECEVTLKEIPLGIASQNPTSGGRGRRTRRLVAGDTLQSVANGEYGKPTMWRAIASANGIEDPTRIPRGTTVLIPSKAEAAEMA